MAQPETGGLAPDFQLATDRDGTLSLSDYRGRPVVLFFYPADDTPGCTNENCAFTELKPEFDALNTVLVGISPDSVKDHARFRAKYGLEVILAADPDHAAIDLYKVWGPKKLAGHAYMGLIRTTFLINADGYIADKWVVLRTKGHAEKVLERLRRMRDGSFA